MNALLLPGAKRVELVAPALSCAQQDLKVGGTMLGDEPAATALAGASVPPCWLANRLRAQWSSAAAAAQSCTRVLDFRRPQEFRRAHIHGSVNVVLPSLIYRRLQRGSVAASSVLTSVDDFRRPRSAPFILVDDACVSSVDSNGLVNDHHLLVARLVCRRLCEEGYPVAFLQGGLTSFLSQYPEFQECDKSANFKCHITGEEAESTARTQFRHLPSNCVAKMKALRIDETSPCDGVAVDKSTATLSNSSGLDCRRSGRTLTCRPLSDNGRWSSSSSSIATVSSAKPSSSSSSSFSSYDYKIDGGHFPVEIISNLYLGNASNAADMDVLVKYNIKYIVNVTRNLPNVFEHDCRFKYLQIPIDDSWSQNLSAHFPQAINFIDEARAQKCGVLVHCLAGISRSVTITVAYLMHKLSLSLDEAYDLVKRHKPNISPNFDFLGQLVEFERLILASRPSVSGAAEPAAGDDDCQIAYHRSSSALAVGTSS